ncbi:MAG TPA: molybdopterin-dependent oxidoreductase [Syntrophorhabdus sp.]|jgi:aldehyde oxidoreductase|nr:molybdopterin-dependent oxidoreductase [Syntrophorhabdus sp.]HOH27674.1 molybdopterin-dependent oxidoreductase [Syntrophorhabdus sp.]HQH83938.1 molybdopterin-dependent oxidoreductase [Syntrophorhabdus sp.]HQM25701.1 molybdopterin-dependent oxidoreductase [Syntrophorhabdus sp.]
MKKVVMKINGKLHQFVVEPDRVLLDLLREDMLLTGAKQSCDRKGQCGACTVIVNGQAVRSCLQKVANLDGAEVITIEGLGTPENPHLIQEAYVLSGAVQCGFCTPGMIMATKALLDRNPNPNVEEIKKALEHNLCRCTGYIKIIEAVQLAARFIRGETTPGAVRPDPNGPKIGVSHPRPSAMLKACGVAPFSADIKLQDALELAVVRSTEHHANIVSIDTSKAEKMPGVVGVITANHIKGTNRIVIIFPDEPILCKDKVQCLGDPIAIVAAQTKQQAIAAAEAVKVTYEPLPVLRSPQEAMAEGAIQIHKEWPNLCFVQPQIKGDAEKAIAESAAVVEASFTTQINHQAPLEPEATVAYMEGEGEDAQLVVVGRSIQIHGVMTNLQEALGYENIRYEEAYSGGQFGIKAAITTEGISAAAALHLQRPVRYIPSIAESMLLTNKRHPFDMKVKLAADENGKLTAFTIDYIVDNGAYQIIGIYVIMRAMWMLSGSYNIPNVNAMGKLVYTNNPAGGAARGAGPPQVTFALESAMDMLAEKIGMDPLRFRKINSLLPGQSVSTGMVYEQWPFPELCDAIQAKYDSAKKEAATLKSGPIKRGVGIATHAFGIGGPGDAGRVAVELDPDDGITIYAAVADPGEGNDSMLTQIASHLTGIPMDKVRLMTRDTDHTAEMGPAAASRMTYMAGGSLVLAIEQLKKAMEEAGVKTYEGLTKAGKPIHYVGSKKAAGQEGPLDPVTGQGPSFESRVHNIQMAEVDVNTDTGEVQVIKMTTAVDAGTVINPQNLEGQLQGGMDQGVGYALREEYVHGKTRDWVTFKFPTMKTSFPTDIIIRETPRVKGPLGATGIGEMTMVSTAPAIINAIYDACGVRIFDLPATPEKIKAALAAKK